MSTVIEGPVVTARCLVVVEGVVQGVGFRPYVHRLATELRLIGTVWNDSSSVQIDIQGDERDLTMFLHRLPVEAPPSARISSIRSDSRRPGDAERAFSIIESHATAGSPTFTPPDSAVCVDCLREMSDVSDRRYRHPFVTCTNCGPRFTIIRSLPYDRPATTMADFPMCAACAVEYTDPADRRFHAQPVSCPDCGPQLWFEPTAAGEPVLRGTDSCLAAAQNDLAAGRVVAVKGIGGWHLACAADDDAALTNLRTRKGRMGKPFAVLVRDLGVAARLAHLDAAEARTLTGPAHPVVLLRRRAGGPLGVQVAPGNPLLGVMLPYSPMHHLLMTGVPGAAVSAPEAIVLTSGNLSEEPICTADDDARERLAGIADAFLGHDRPIHVPCDDSVVRMVDGRELPIRRSRGYAPLPVDLGRVLPSVLAAGGELKNTACVVQGRHAFLSQHLGDMGSMTTLEAFDRMSGQLATLHGARPVAIAADLHPGYHTRRWAEDRAAELWPGGEPVLVQHHHAHVVSLLAEHGRLVSPWSVWHWTGRVSAPPVRRGRAKAGMRRSGAGRSWSSSPTPPGTAAPGTCARSRSRAGTPRFAIRGGSHSRT